MTLQCDSVPDVYHVDSSPLSYPTCSQCSHCSRTQSQNPDAVSTHTARSQGQVEAFNDVAKTSVPVIQRIPEHSASSLNSLASSTLHIMHHPALHADEALLASLHLHYWTKITTRKPFNAQTDLGKKRRGLQARVPCR